MTDQTVAAAAAKLVRTKDMHDLQKKLAALPGSTADKAEVLVVAIRDHGVNANLSGLYQVLLQSASPLAPDLLASLLVRGQVRQSLQGEHWWRDEANTQNLYRDLYRLVRRLGTGGARLRAHLEAMDPFTRCMVEIALAAEGVLSLAQISPESRAGFLSMVMKNSFPDSFDEPLQAVWGRGALLALAEQSRALSWPISHPERFLPIWDRLSPETAAALLSRGYWDDIAMPSRLLGASPVALRPALLDCADAWLAVYADAGVSYGGYGSIITALGLQRSGGLEPRHFRLVVVSMYANSDLPYLHEVMGALPLEERETRALRWPRQLDLLYAAVTPTPAVFARMVEQVMGWKASMDEHTRSNVRRVMAAWGAGFAPTLLERLDGTRAPCVSLLLEALAALRLPEAAPVFARYLDHKQTVVAAVQGLALLGAAALPTIEEALFASKKPLRLGAAQALALLPPSAASRALAARRLEKERAADVVALLVPLVA